MKITDLKTPAVVYSPSGNQTQELQKLSQTDAQTGGMITRLQTSFNDASLNVLKGVGKGIGSTIFGVAKLGETMISPVVKPLERITGVEIAAPLGERPEFLKPEGVAQSIGFGAEQIAEFLLPSSAVLKGAKAIEAVGKASKLGSFAQGALKVGGRAALEGVASGGIRAAQTQSFESGAKFGAVAGGISAGVGATAEFLRRSGIQEKLYAQVFRNTGDDMLKELKTGALKNLKTTHPDEFRRLVEAGIVKTDKAGEVVFNPTLAREALDRGLRGSLKNMTNEVVRQNLNYELKAQNLTEGFTEKLKIPEARKYVNLLKQVQAQYKGTFLQGRGEIAGGFIKEIEKTKGNLSAKNVLKLRRFLDSMRRASSYRPNPALSIAQDDFRKATDLLRGTLSDKIPGMKGLMNEYRFTFDALESLGKEASRRGNAAIVNLIDTALFGFGGVLTQGMAGAAAFPLARRALTLPSVVTKLGSVIEKGTGGTVFRGIKGAVSQLLPPPQ